MTGEAAVRSAGGPPAASQTAREASGAEVEDAMTKATAHRHEPLPRVRVAHLVYAPAIGGSEICAGEICRHLDPARYDAFVLFLQGEEGPLSRLLREQGTECHSLGWSPAWRLLGSLLLARRFRQLRIDVLHVHHISLLRTVYTAARRAGICRVVLTEHAKHSISRFPVLQKAARELVSRVDACTVITQNLRHFLVNEVGVSPEPIQVIPNGVDPDGLQPAGNPSAIASLVPDHFDGCVLVSVGRLVEAKDHFTLLAALAELRDQAAPVFLVLVGDGELRSDLESAVTRHRLEDHVVLAGQRSDVPELLSGADVFVMSSKREGLPMAVLEAMSAGLPVVSTDVGGIPEVVEDGLSGVLVPPGQPKALARALASLAADPGRREALACAARRRVVEHFDIRRVAERYAAIYTQLAEGETR